MTIKPRICIFLQVRLDSVRLPKKALLDLAGKTVIEHAMMALNDVPARVRALLTDADSKPELSPLADSCGFSLFTGPKEDVLLRFAQAAAFYKADLIIRATGDNPLVSADLASLLLARCEGRKPHYAGFLGMPLGMGVELLSREALDTAAAEAVDPYEREHVTPFIIRRPNRFRVFRPLAPDDVRFSARVTLDTRAEYDYIRDVFTSLYRGKPIAARELVDWLKTSSRSGSPHTCCV